MKIYNKIPFKERKRHYDYQYKQTDRQEEICLKHEEEKLKQERKKLDALHWEQSHQTEKEREVEEVYKRLKSIAKDGAE